MIYFLVKLLVWNSGNHEILGDQVMIGWLNEILGEFYDDCLFGYD